jgi:predicted metal-dependent phosphoesterase TrpH
MVYETTLCHYGIKGQKWGVRRFQNPDGTLTTKGKKRYRKDYDHLKTTQNLADRAKTTNRTGISVVDKYNSKHYSKQAKRELKSLVRKIGDKGLSQLDDDIKREGKIAAEKAKRESELWNKKLEDTYGLDGDYGYNRAFLRDPKSDYDYTYNRYLEDNLIRR